MRNSWTARTLLLLLVGLSLIAATPGPTACASPLPPAPEQRHSTGLVILGPVPRCVASPFESLAKPYSDARLLAEAYPNDFGYPWADQVKRELATSVTSAEGERLARSWMAGGATVAAGTKTAVLPPPTVPVRIMTVPRSVAQIVKLEDDIIAFTGEGGADASAIHRLGPDEEHDRVAIEVDHLTDALAMALASRFGTDAIAVRVDPSSSNAGSASAGLGGSDLWVYAAAAFGAAMFAIGLVLALRRRTRDKIAAPD